MRLWAVTILVLGVAGVSASVSWTLSRALKEAPPPSPEELFRGPDVIDQTMCNPDANTRDYLSPSQFSKLKALINVKGSDTSPFDDLSPGQERIMAASLTLGPDRSAYSARLLRSLEIIRELDLQASCMIDSACNTTGDLEDISLISTLKTGAPNDPNKNKSWPALASEWRAYAKQDIDRGKNCFLY